MQSHHKSHNKENIYKSEVYKSNKVIVITLISKKCLLLFFFGGGGGQANGQF